MLDTDEAKASKYMRPLGSEMLNALCLARVSKNKSSSSVSKNAAHLLLRNCQWNSLVIKAKEAGRRVEKRKKGRRLTSDKGSLDQINSCNGAE